MSVVLLLSKQFLLEFSSSPGARQEYNLVV